MLSKGYVGEIVFAMFVHPRALSNFAVRNMPQSQQTAGPSRVEQSINAYYYFHVILARTQKSIHILLSFDWNDFWPVKLVVVYKFMCSVTDLYIFDVCMFNLKAISGLLLRHLNTVAVMQRWQTQALCYFLLLVCCCWIPHAVSRAIDCGGWAEL